MGSARSFLFCFVFCFFLPRSGKNKTVETGRRRKANWTLGGQQLKLTRWLARERERERLLQWWTYRGHDETRTSSHFFTFQSSSNPRISGGKTNKNVEYVLLQRRNWVVNDEHWWALIGIHATAHTHVHITNWSTVKLAKILSLSLSPPFVLRFLR